MRKARPEREQKHADDRHTKPASPFHHWLKTWKPVVEGKSLPADIMAGITVAAVALPLNLALAVACGLPPLAGLVAGVVGGLVAGVFGGSPLQVTGPAAALNVMVFALAREYGATGVASACLIIGAIQILMALLRLGKVAALVPESVLAGFTSGVGIKLLDGQLPELLGFDYKVSELAQMIHRPTWLHEVSWLSVVCGLGVALLVVGTKQFKQFPAALVGIVFVTAVSVYVGFNIERVGAIPDKMPPPMWPPLAHDKWFELGLKTVPLALLAAAESLLSAKAIDRMAGYTTKAEQHEPDVELGGQGLANLASGIFSGMPVSGVVVRSGVNVQSGGKSRLSSIIHGFALLAAVLFASKLLAKIPLAALAGLLCVIGLRLVEFKTFYHIVKESKVDALAFVVTLIGTVTGHLVMGMGLGLGLAYIHHLLRRRGKKEVAAKRTLAEKGIRHVLTGPDRAKPAKARDYQPPPTREGWLRHIRERAQIATSAFVHGQATVIGRVVLGEHVHIAAGSSVRADEGSPFYIGDDTNVQDGVVIHALKGKHVHVSDERWAVYVGRRVSMAHGALIHGPCYVGDDTFIGFQAVVHDSIVGQHCFIGIGAIVVGVEIPDGRFVPHGAIVDSAEAVEKLPEVTDAHMEFNEDVVDVNRGLAAAYRAHAPEAKLALHRATFDRPHARPFDKLVAGEHLHAPSVSHVGASAVRTRSTLSRF